MIGSGRIAAILAVFGSSLGTGTFFLSKGSDVPANGTVLTQSGTSSSSGHSRVRRSSPSSGDSKKIVKKKGKPAKGAQTKGVKVKEIVKRVRQGSAGTPARRKGNPRSPKAKMR
ncbi:hypothetical protein MHLP_03125 [Candidatus Mycoplasma haematolamae str. Purdue]|uniref:Uncharacterized protein n=1 Tax=Mycoplasma haematolamae (strain Purdue) TaxID=1212765 RepID=I7BA86_MYCHA|nr:hypothetical protein [Candidatus Mycoplasma haematolamae]AFO52205.1 hypothetical protein MHLP_03125 [Candidatus Mycoplasma haematolamae str. Purdue]